ncbi:MAG: hypothetical protein DRO40_06640 [Thermoprotei archaeon]|nr:MAG: hypothetical protein DRO40_06640 [Thermoprotei archaeon]
MNENDILTKEDLLHYIIDYARRYRIYFSMQEIIDYIIARRRLQSKKTNPSTIARKIRRLVKQGFLYRKKVIDQSWNLPRFVFYVNIVKIKAYLERRGVYRYAR